MAILTLLLYCLCPIVSIPFFIYGIINDKKHKFVYILILSFFLSILAYHFIPEQNDDLYRHHYDVIRFGNMSFSEFINILKTHNEQLSYIIKYLIYKTGNINLLQFFITFICYAIMFLMLDDFNKKSDISKMKFIVITLFTIISISYIGVISNLFMSLALIIFSLGVYFEYVCKKNKLICYLLYVCSLLFHASLILPIIILLLFKCTGEKVNLKFSIMLFLGIFFIGNIINFLNDHLSLSIISEINSFYNNYFLNVDKFSYLHSKSLLITYLIKLIPYFIAYFSIKEKDKIDNFSFLILIMILALFIKTTFSIRFIPIVQLCGIPLLYKSLSSSKNRKYILVCVLIIIIPQIYFQYLQIRQSYFDDVSSIIINNIISNFKN